MFVGEEVILNTLMRKGDFPGKISHLSLIQKCCSVKLDCQEKIVTDVLYFEKEPKVVNSSFWQICYPKKGNLK
jgi:hypothetical protein